MYAIHGIYTHAGGNPGEWILIVYAIVALFAGVILWLESLRYR